MWSIPPRDIIEKKKGSKRTFLIIRRKGESKEGGRLEGV